MLFTGQKVVCINDVFPLGIEVIVPNLPKEGQVYTIREIGPGVSLGGVEGEVAVYLQEIRNPLNAHGIERGFDAERFAPLTQVTEAEEYSEPVEIGMPVLVPA